ncbi:hypothetical protein ONZ51_g8551 [Trametes cubensis]|uniref:Uncharacterized protein n=1 Tax=Trametes cubensis TaxID=1111947 RepID=A0AAD7TP80_9APHY|nr:hypothetical protein ONZ51_g8551 [Trametes cubensis]
MPRRLPVTDWNFDTDADVPTVSYPPTLSPNSHICRHSMFKPDALLAERRASSSSRRSNNAGRTRPGKFRASSHSSVPQPRHRQDATSSPTIAHTMDATSPTTRHAYPAKLGRGDARYGKNCDCSKGSRYMLPWPTLLTLYAWNVASVSCAKASVIPTPAPRTSSHAISVIMSSSAETGAYTYIPRWRRQATHAGGSTDGRVSNGNDDLGFCLGELLWHEFGIVSGKYGYIDVVRIYKLVRLHIKHYISIDIVLFHFGELTSVNFTPNAVPVLFTIAASDYVPLALATDQPHIYDLKLDNVKHYLEYNSHKWELVDNELEFDLYLIGDVPNVWYLKLKHEYINRYYKWYLGEDIYDLVLHENNLYLFSLHLELYPHLYLSPILLLQPCL